MLGCIPPNTVITYDPAKPGDDDPVMYTTTFNSKRYVFHRNSTWVSVHLPWYKRLWWRLRHWWRAVRPKVLNSEGERDDNNKV